MDKTQGKIIIDGNAAAALGAVFGGCTVVTWYPITPSTSLVETMIDYMKEYRIDPKTGKATFAIVQAEDELTAVGMVIGAGWAGALAHRGTAFLDVISPCVTFNNHEGSTKSYKYAKESEELLHEINFVPFYEQITVDYEAGLTKVVELHDGSHITLKKLERDYNPMNKPEALRQIRASTRRGEFLTGLIYIDPAKDEFTQILNMHDEPLATLAPERVRPSREALEEIMESLRQQTPPRHRDHGESP